MTQPVLNNSNYSNRSTNKVGTVSTFGVSKFGPEQAKVRYQEHARALISGTTTLPQLVQLWKEKFGIEVSVNTEKEFRQRNRDKIDKIALEMIESGELSVPSIGAEAVTAAITGKLMVSKKLVESMQKNLVGMLKHMSRAVGTTESKSGMRIRPSNPKGRGPGWKRAKKPPALMEIEAYTRLYKVITEDYRADLALVTDTAKVRQLNTGRVNKAAEEQSKLTQHKLKELPIDLAALEITDEMRDQFESTETDSG
jgi:hypothetical protein